MAPTDFRLRQVISLIFRKSLRLSGRARLKHSSGQITTLISADAARLDLASATIHKYVLFSYSIFESVPSSDGSISLWINPIQV